MLPLQSRPIPKMGSQISSFIYFLAFWLKFGNVSRMGAQLWCEIARQKVWTQCRPMANIKAPTGNVMLARILPSKKCGTVTQKVAVFYSFLRYWEQLTLVQILGSPKEPSTRNSVTQKPRGVTWWYLAWVQDGFKPFGLSFRTYSISTQNAQTPKSQPKCLIAVK